MSRENQERAPRNPQPDRRTIDREEHLSNLAAAACPGLSVDAAHFDNHLPDLVTVGWLQPITGGWMVLLDPRLPMPAAEQTVLHECAHLLLGHSDSDAYAQALSRDARDLTDLHRGPWEIAADAAAVALAESLAGVLISSVDEILEESARDEAHFSQHDAQTRGEATP